MAENVKPPERLWKYRTWDKKNHTRDLIVNGAAYFSNVELLNDPFEFRWRTKFPTDPRVRDTYIRELLASNNFNESVELRRVKYEQLSDSMQRLITLGKNGTVLGQTGQTLGVFCMSAVCDNILMWSHYAQNHSGVCVSIRTDKLGNRRIRSVNYQEKIPVADAWFYVNREEGTFVDLSLAKASDWSYEQEWRTGHLPGLHTFPGCVDRVIIGARATAETKSAVYAAVAEAKYGIQVVEAKISDWRYGLDIDFEKPEKPRPNARKGKGNNRRTVR